MCFILQFILHPYHVLMFKLCVLFNDPQTEAEFGAACCSVSIHFTLSKMAVGEKTENGSCRVNLTLTNLAAD